MRLNIGIFASHGGSNMEAIIDACKEKKINGKVYVVICNNSGAAAVEKAEKNRIPLFHLSNRNYPNPSNLDEAILLVLKKHKINLVVLAGYMKKLGPAVLSEYRNRIINIHPALLPKYGGKGMYGMNVHEAVIASGDEKSGATVHLVNDKYDEGRILSQVFVDIDEEDTAATLADKILKQEHRLYTATLDKISSGDIIL